MNKVLSNVDGVLPELSIVLPIFNEEKTIPHLLERIKAFSGLTAQKIEVIFVDDGSSDHSLALLKAAASGAFNFKIISFSRNFGHQMAITCGLEQSRGRAVIVMDADLQDPPELINDMLNKWRQGTDIVICKREKRQGESWFKLFSAAVFYRVLSRMTEVPIVLDAGDFYLLDRKVVDVLNACPERARFLRGLIAWAGFTKTIIVYERAARAHGQTNYTFKKMWQLAMNAIFGFSKKPINFIHWITVLSLLLALFSVIDALSSYVQGKVVPGWTTMVLLVSFFGGLIFCALGIIAEYVYRIFEETQGRPKYIIKERVDHPGSLI